MSVRTPDPNPGWLSDEDLYEARRRLPMVYVEAIPVRLDSLGYVTEIGLLYVADETGTFQRTFVSGRVQYRETIRAVIPDREHTTMAFAPISMEMPQTAWEIASTVFLIRNSAARYRFR